MNEDILRQLRSKASIEHVVFATVAIGSGVDTPDIQHVGQKSSRIFGRKMCTQENGSPRQDGKNGQLSQPQRLVPQHMHLRKQRYPPLPKRECPLGFYNSSNSNQNVITATEV